MQYNNIAPVTGQLYIGTETGQRIEKALADAQKSIYVISPYVSEHYLRLLLNKQTAGVSVNGLFCENKVRTGTHNSPTLQNRLGLANIVRSLLQVTRISLDDGIRRRQQQKNIACIFYALSIISFVGLLLLFYTLYTIYSEAGNLDAVPAFSLLIKVPGILILPLLFALIASSISKSRRNIPITKLQYQFSANLLFFKEPTTFPHIKAIIIDEKTAFIGSMNLTYSGLHKNLESCLITHDYTIIESLLTLYHSFNSSDFYSAQELGELYLGKYEH